LSSDWLVTTNSLVIAQAVDRLKGRQRERNSILTGGILQPESSALSDRPAEAFLKRYHARWAFHSAGRPYTKLSHYR
jgi:DeoR/GlpR family transcriptional regulator of sugar metabolism